MRRDFTQGAFLLRIGFFGQYLKAILGTISCLSDNLSFDHATMTVEECPLSLYPGGGVISTRGWRKPCPTFSPFSLAALSLVLDSSIPTSSFNSVTRGRQFQMFQPFQRWISFKGNRHCRHHPTHRMRNIVRWEPHRTLRTHPPSPVAVRPHRDTAGQRAPLPGPPAADHRPRLSPGQPSGPPPPRPGPSPGPPRHLHCGLSNRPPPLAVASPAVWGAPPFRPRPAAPGAVLSTSDLHIGDLPDAGLTRLYFNDPQWVPWRCVLMTRSVFFVFLFDAG